MESSLQTLARGRNLQYFMVMCSEKACVLKSSTQACNDSVYILGLYVERQPLHGISVFSTRGLYTGFRYWLTRQAGTRKVLVSILRCQMCHLPLRVGTQPSRRLSSRRLGYFIEPSRRWAYEVGGNVMTLSIYSDHMSKGNRYTEYRFSRPEVFTKLARLG